MEITTVSIVGLGALGVLFGDHLSKHMPWETLRIVADSDRIKKYRRDGVFCNSKPCDFNYITPDEIVLPADLLIIAVKYSDLPAAIEASRNQVGSETVILSLLNGISSEEIIGEAFGMDKMLYSVAQGMDAVKVGNRLTYENMGKICFGAASTDESSEKVEEVKRFFEKTNLPHEVVSDMQKRLWSKFMLNVGVNQVSAVFGCDYGGLQKEGSTRSTMLAAMEEAMILSEKENVNLTQADIEYWLRILDGLNPQGKPSMLQDIEAKRHSEVELFSGTILALGKKHGLTFPINQMLYGKLKAMESTF
ncbi:MAG: 2-dehydropantoate 2-reductase [Firmicutes bacterium HGW-Firmicutes-16]|nr:MAG: 2-dehydropantoate 2-reductase [Firmicutes bacterium HGW-Firmicutes-16]